MHNNWGAVRIGKDDAKWEKVRREISRSNYHEGKCRHHVINSHHEKGWRLLDRQCDDFAGYVQAPAGRRDTDWGLHAD